MNTWRNRAGRLLVRLFCLEFLRNNLVISVVLTLIINIDTSKINADNLMAVIDRTLNNLLFCILVLGPLGAWMVFFRFQRHTVHLWYNLGFTRLKLFFLGLGVSWLAGVLLVLPLVAWWPHG